MAFVVLQVHNLIPHQHQAIAKEGHSHHHATDHHHGAEDHHQSEGEEDHSGTPIPDLNHNADFEKSIIQPKTSHEATDDWACPMIELNAVFPLLLTKENPPPDNFFHRDQNWWPPLISLTSFSHRGPPAFIVEA